MCSRLASGVVRIYVWFSFGVNNKVGTQTTKKKHHVPTVKGQNEKQRSGVGFLYGLKYRKISV